MAPDDERALRSSSWWEAGALDRIGHRLAVPDAGLPRGVVHRPTRHRHPEQLERGRRLQRAPARPRRARQARRAPRGRLSRRDPGDLAGRADHQADRDAVSEPDGDGRRGADPRQSRSTASSSSRAATRRFRRASWARPAWTSRRSWSPAGRCSTAASATRTSARARTAGGSTTSSGRTASAQADWHEFEAGMCRSDRPLLADGHRLHDGLRDRGARAWRPAGSAAIPAVDSRRRHVAERAGVQIMDLVAAGTRPSDIMTRDAFENAIRTLHAIGGSTNAVIHLIAIAGRLGVDLPLDLFDELAGVDAAAGQPQAVRRVPDGGLLLRGRPAGGPCPDRRPPPPRRADRDRPDPGRGDPRRAGSSNDDVIRPRDQPLLEGGSLAILRGNLCPDGAVLKVSAASTALLQHEGRAVVFRSVDELHATIDDPALDIRRTTSSCSRTAGRSARPACPSPGHLPMPVVSAAPGRHRHGPDQRRPDERHRVRDGRPAHRPRVGRSVGRSPWSRRATASAWTPRAAVSTCSSATRSSRRRRAAWVPRPPSDERGYRGLYVGR